MYIKSYELSLTTTNSSGIKCTKYTKSKEVKGKDKRQIRTKMCLFVFYAQWEPLDSILVQLWL